MATTHQGDMIFIAGPQSAVSKQHEYLPKKMTYDFHSNWDPTQKMAQHSKSWSSFIFIYIIITNHINIVFHDWLFLQHVPTFQRGMLFSLRASGELRSRDHECSRGVAELSRQWKLGTWPPIQRDVSLAVFETCLEYVFDDRCLQRTVDCVAQTNYMDLNWFEHAHKHARKVQWWFLEYSFDDRVFDLIDQMDN